MSDLSINPEETTTNIIEFIRDVTQRSGFSKVVVGLSGGIDSSVSAALAVRALGPENVFPAIFPYGELNKEGKKDAGKVSGQLKIPANNVTAIDIKPLIDPVITAVIGKSLTRYHDRGESSNNNSQEKSGIVNLRKGNIMVRMRMIFLYDMSKKFNALVLGTENRTEYLLGYFTRFGDEASDIEPLISLYKTQVMKLAGYLKLPDNIIRKAPTAGMWQGQTDEGEFGFSYEEADKILHLYVDKKKSREEIVRMGVNKEIIERIISRLRMNEFKHKLPYNCILTRY